MVTTAPPHRRRRQPDATYAALVEAATDHFARLGYDGTRTEDVVRAAGLTRGALYHHFDDKLALFREVLVRVTAEAIAAVRSGQRHRPSADRWDEAIEGVLAYLDACLDPGRARILLVDGPQVFGLLTAAELAEQSRESDWRRVLTDAMDEGLIDRLPVAALAHQLTAAVTEAGVYVTRAADPEAAHRDSRTVLRRMLEGLRQQPTDRP